MSHTPLFRAGPPRVIPAMVAFGLAAMFVVLGFILGGAHFLFAGFSAFVGLIYSLGGGAADQDDFLGSGPAVPGGCDAKSQYHFGPPE